MHGELRNIIARNAKRSASRNTIERPLYCGSTLSPVGVRINGAGTAWAAAQDVRVHERLRLIVLCDARLIKRTSDTFHWQMKYMRL
jgi:hypothetical protein